MKKKFLLGIFFVLGMHSLLFPRAEEIERPMFAGTVLAYLPLNTPPKELAFFYLTYANRVYSAYDASGHLNGSSNFSQMAMILVSETGITKFLDVTLIIDGINNYSNGYGTVLYGDTQLQLGFQVNVERKGCFLPDCRFIVSEQFPTGKYQNFNPKKQVIQSSGSGSYETTLILVLQKIFGNHGPHPFNINLNVIYTFPSSVKVHNINTYGGGFGTKGRVYPGQKLICNLAYEYKFNPAWGWGIDFRYHHKNKSPFKGTMGSLNGRNVDTGLPSSELWSIAPGIEYNFSPSLSLAIGPWISFGGRNSSAFVNIVTDLYFNF